MEDQCSPLSWEFSYHEEGMEELRHSLLYTTFELETTLLAAKEEITKREYELIHRPLPEKGKLLQAVIEAGPLLKNLLLAGPLPQWQHPPPQLNSIEIPPVAISSPTPRLLQQDSCINFNGGFNSKSNSL
ncbi:hypothetical protein CFP56_009190 [Quercus suber]|uniref:Uncharacterized protein n=1 Tax=Quercus suber TaxID=58331 RepID=A0AAW0L139_QUESU